MQFVVEIDGVVDPINKINSVPIQKVSNIQRPFLKVFVRQQRCKHRFDLLPDKLVFADLHIVKLVPHDTNVVDDLSSSLCHILRERHIDLRQILIEPV